MRVLLVNPRIPGFGGNGLFPHTGLCSLASNAGVSVDLWDDGLFRQEPKWTDYDVVGFTTTTPAMERVYELTRKAKGRLVVYGGPHVTALPNDPYPADALILGEGEPTFARWLENPRPGRFIGTELPNLDALTPPAYDLLPTHEYKGQPVLGNKRPIGVISTSRGCPYDCKFCFKAMFGTHYRFMCVDRVLEEIESWVRRGAAEFTVSDDAFATKLDRVHSICEHLIKHPSLPWTCSNGIRVETPLETLRLMKLAGCYRVALGIESGNQTILDQIGKNSTLEKVRAGVKNCRDAGIKTMGFFILGLPWDTAETMRDTIDFAASLPLDYAQFSLATPYPGTELARIVKDRAKIIATSFSLYESITYEMPGQWTVQDVKRLLKQAYWRFYSSRLRRIDTWRMLLRKLHC